MTHLVKMSYCAAQHIKSTPHGADYASLELRSSAPKQVKRRLDDIEEFPLGQQFVVLNQIMDVCAELDMIHASAEIEKQLSPIGCVAKVYGAPTVGSRLQVRSRHANASGNFLGRLLVQTKG